MGEDLPFPKIAKCLKLIDIYKYICRTESVLDKIRWRRSLASVLDKIMAKHDQAEYDRVWMDVAGGFFMALIGDNMKIFVCIVNSLLKDCRLFEGKRLPGRSKYPKGRNIIFPRGADDNDVHWVFQDRNGDIHNPYKYNMQRDGSQQFCQSHALLLAYKYCKGMPITQTYLPDAYEELLGFWQLLINELKHAPCVARRALIEEVRDKVLEEQIELGESEAVIEDIERNFPPDIQDMLEFMKTGPARDHFPYLL